MLDPRANTDETTNSGMLCPLHPLPLYRIIRIFTYGKSVPQAWKVLVIIPDA